MYEFLDKFEKRMEWLGVAHSIINRKGKKTEIEELFSENQLTGIIISVLLFIMEKTLEQNNECDMAAIESFLSELLFTYYTDGLTQQQIHHIADYIVKSILQNNGVSYTYPVMNYNKNRVEEVTIRLISDKIVNDSNGRKIVYMLTNQGYDFLFRLREVDEEIQLTIEQLKLKEYIKRKKFSSAVRQSVELITYVRQKKREIDNFILSIRQNIHSVDIDKYEALIKSTYSMLEEEYETMTEIQNMIYQAEQRIKEEFKENEAFTERLQKARQEVQEIHHNIGVVITEQRDLIINRRSLTDLYMDTIRKSFEFSLEKRYDFEQVIISALESYSGSLDNYLKIVRSLFQPLYSKILGIPQIYAPQIIIKDEENPDALLIPMEEFDDNREKERIRIISERYVQAIGIFIREALRTGEAALSTILEDLKNNQPERYEDLKTQRTIFMPAIKLYDMGTLHITDFFEKSKRVMMTPTEELNVEYCLVKLQDMIPELSHIKEFSIEKLKAPIHDTISYQEGELNIIENIEMSDLLFRVVM